MTKDLYICCRVRACKWRGTNDELKSIKDRRSSSLHNRVCPKCYHREFYVQKVCASAGCDRASTHYSRLNGRITFDHYCDSCVAKMAETPGITIHKHQN